MKIKITIAVLLLVCLAGCGEQVLPPAPEDPGVSKSSRGGLVGFAFRNLDFNAASLDQFSPPIDPFDNFRVIYSIYDEVFVEASGEQVVDLRSFAPTGAVVASDHTTPPPPRVVGPYQLIDAYHPEGYIWGTAYYLNSESFQWEEISLNGDRVGGSNWIEDGSYGEYYLSPDYLEEGENYIIAYSCKRYDNEWKCGCRDTDDSCNRWMLQSFNVIKDDLPPGPPGPPGFADPRIITEDISGWTYRDSDSGRDCFSDLIPDCRLAIGEYEHENVDAEGVVAFATAREGATNSEILEELSIKFEEFEFDEHFGLFPFTFDEHQIYRMVSPESFNQGFLEFYLWHSEGNLIAVGAFFDDFYGTHEHLSTLRLVEAYLDNFPSTLRHEYIATCYDRNKVGYYRGDEDNNQFVAGEVESNHIDIGNGDTEELASIFTFRDECTDTDRLREFYCDGSVKFEENINCDCANGYCIHPLVVQEIDGVKLTSIENGGTIFFNDNPQVEGYRATYLLDFPASRRIYTKSLIQQFANNIDHDSFFDFLDNQIPGYREILVDDYVIYVSDIEEEVVHIWFSGPYILAVIANQELYDNPLIESTVRAYLSRYPSEIRGVVVGPVGEIAPIRGVNDMLEIGENLGDVLQTMTSEHLYALRDGIAVNSLGEYDYTQTLSFNGDSSYVDFSIDDDDDDDIPADYLYIRDNAELYKYKLDFLPSLQSTIEGDVDSSSGGRLIDFENIHLEMMGRSFNIVNARKYPERNVKLRLYASAVHDLLEGGATRTYTLEGRDYELSVVNVDQGSEIVQFVVNGESTHPLAVGDGTTFSDGLHLTVRNLILGAGGDVNLNIVEFYLGTDELIISDTDMDSVDGGSLEVNNENIEDVDVEIFGSDDGTHVFISGIKIVLHADDDLYVAAGTGTAQQLDEPGGFFTQNFDIVYDGLKLDGGYSQAILSSSGDRQQILSFVNRQGVNYNIPIVSVINSGENRLGDDSEDKSLIIKERISSRTLEPEDFPILVGDYFVLNANNLVGSAQDGITHIMQLKDVDSTNNVLKFLDVGFDGQVFEISYGGISDGFDTAILLDGHPFGIDIQSDTDDSPISVDLNGNGELVGGEQPFIVTYNGPHIVLTPASDFLTKTEGDILQLDLIVDDSVIDDAEIQDEVIRVPITVSPVPALDIGGIQQIAKFDEGPESDGLTSYADHFQNGMHTIGSNPARQEISTYGIKVTQLVDLNGPDHVIFDIPDSQVEALVSVVVGFEDNCAELPNVDDRDSCYMNLVVNGDHRWCHKIENPHLKASCESIVKVEK